LVDRPRLVQFCPRLGVAFGVVGGHALFVQGQREFHLLLSNLPNGRTADSQCLRFAPGRPLPELALTGHDVRVQQER
jgi:hypothetical protein